MLGNLCNGLLWITLAALFLCLGLLLEWTIVSLPQMIRDFKEWKRWRRAHSLYGDISRR